MSDYTHSTLKNASNAYGWKIEGLKQEQRMQTNSRAKMKSKHTLQPLQHWKIRCFWILAFTETGKLSDATGRSTQQTHSDTRHFDSKHSVGKMCEQDYFSWFGSRKMFTVWLTYCWWHILQGCKSLHKRHNLHMPGFASAGRFCVLSLFVKHTWPWICCVFHGNRKMHSARKAFTHLPVAF